MVKKNFLYILVALFAISVLFTGCGADKDDKMPTQSIKVESDTTVKPTASTKNAVDSSFDKNVVTTSDVEIGSLI